MRDACPSPARSCPLRTAAIGTVGRNCEQPPPFPLRLTVARPPAPAEKDTLQKLLTEELARNEPVNGAPKGTDALVFGVSDWKTLSEADHARQADAYRRVLTSTEPIGPLPALSAWETWRPGRAEGTSSGL